MPVLYCVTEKMKGGYILVEDAEVKGDGEMMEVGYNEDDIRLKTDDESPAYDFVASGIIRSILELSDDTANLFVICSQKLYHRLTGQGEKDFRTK